MKVADNRSARSALITGGAGFIGSHLTEALLAAGMEVYIIDDLSTGSIRNLDAVRDNPKLHVHLDTIANEQLLIELVDRVDEVYHLAAAVGVKLIVQDPVRTIETNIYGTELVLKQCARKGRRLMLASTSEVYGKGQNQAFNEGDDLLFGATTKSRWSYGCSKAIDEFLALAYNASRDLPVVVCRFFNTVGPRQIGNYGMVVPRFVQQALAGGPITVYGDGEQVRCFAHVADVIEATCTLMRTGSAVGQIFNVGSDSPTSINGLAQTVRELVNPDVEIVHIPYEEAYEAGFEDIRLRIPNIGKLRAAIGYEPKRDLQKILSDVSNHLRDS